MSTITIITFVLFIGWFFYKKYKNRAMAEEELMSKIDDILDEVREINSVINPEENDDMILERGYDETTGDDQSTPDDKLPKFMRE